MNTCDEGIINIEGSHKSCSNSSSMSSINGSQFKTSLGYDSQQQMKIHRTLKILGILLIVLSLVCIIVTIPLSVELHPMSVSSGFWCSVFVFCFGIYARSSADMAKSKRVILSFGCVVAYFTLLMVALEISGIFSARVDRLVKYHQTVIVLHGFLAVISIVELLLVVLYMVLYCRNSSRPITKQTSSDAESTSTKQIIKALV